MGFQISAGVQVLELDLTGVVPAVATSIGGFVGMFQWGPVMQVQTISSEIDLVKFFGKPDNTTYGSFFSAANFLAYSNTLNLVRVVTNTAKNATANAAGLLIKNELDWEDNDSAGTAGVGTFAAKYPGAVGNSLKISMCDNNTFQCALEGTISTMTNSTTVIGVGTAFTTQTHVGAWLYVSIGGPLIGQVLTINSDLSITLTANALVALGGSTAVAYWEFWKLFNGPPGTTTYATSFGGSNDGLHIVIEDHDGSFTSVPGTILETFAGVSKAIDARTDSGVVNYYLQVLITSDYAWWMAHPTNIGSGAAWGSSASSIFSQLNGVESRKLAGGLDGGAVADADVENGWGLFLNAEAVNVNLLIAGPWSINVAQFIVQDVAEVRRDCVAFVSPLLSDVYNQAGFEAGNIVVTRNNMNLVSSYGFMDSGWKYQYDKYSDIYRWVPLNPDVAGLCARTDSTNDPWWSPGGFTRGQIKNVTKLAWSPNQSDRDTLYSNGVNPVVNFPGQGVILYGDKTMLSNPSAFDRINVRRLFITLEKAIAIAAKAQLFEFNDAFTQAQFRNMVEPFLRDVKGRRGITDFLCVCDSTNNTSDIVDTNQFVADIYVKPSRSINFITLSFIATRSSVDFSEVVGTSSQ